MSALRPPRQLLRRAQSYGRSSYLDVETALPKCLSRLCLSPHRPFSSSLRRPAESETSIREPSKQVPSRGTPRSSTETPASAFIGDYLKAKPGQLRKTDSQIAAEKTQAAKVKNDKQIDEARKVAERQGTLADNSLFAEAEVPEAARRKDPYSLADRNFENLNRALVPRPNARTRWQQKMVIRQVRRGGRLTKEMKIARTERSHLSKSHFFKTSMKKLAPLARQIAGKSVDEALLQMRFSVKKAARDIRQHLLQARDEAIVMRGMGLPPQIGLDNPGSQTDQMLKCPGKTAQKMPSNVSRQTQPFNHGL